MKKPGDIKEFCKLLKIHIPYYNEFEYYIDVLSQSKEYENIKSLVDHFCDFEQWVQENGYESVAQYKMKYAFPKIVDFIKTRKLFNYFKNMIIPTIKCQPLIN